MRARTGWEWARWLGLGGLLLLGLGGCLGWAWWQTRTAPHLEARRVVDQPVERYEGWLQRDVRLYTELCRPRGRGPFQTVILVHGGQWGPTDSLRQLCWAWAREGFLVALPHLRGQGQSGGQVGLCARESDDLKPLVQALRRRGGEPRVALVGFSMGACVALRAARHADWVAGVAHVLGPTDLIEQVELLRRAGRLEAALRRELLIGGSPEDCPDCYAERNPLAFAGQVQVPLLIVQAGNDPLVPSTHGCRLAEIREAQARRVYRVALTREGRPWNGPLIKRRACLGEFGGLGPLSQDHLVMFPDLDHRTTPAMLELVLRAVKVWLE